MRHSLVLPLLLVGIGTIACDSAAAPRPEPPPASVLGCYDVTLGPWSGPRESPDPPPQLILTDSIGTVLFESGQTLVRGWPDPATIPLDFAWWTRPESDRVELIFSSGYIGLRLHLTWNGEEWRGPIEAFTDVDPPIEATAQVRLTARPCA